jgi:hypothetical protein
MQARKYQEDKFVEEPEKSESLASLQELEYPLDALTPKSSHPSVAQSTP